MEPVSARRGSAEHVASGVRVEAGFTLVELMVVIFLIGLLVLVAVPFLQQGTRDSQANAAARELWTDLVYTKTEAVRTGVPHLVEFCDDPPGYVVVRCSTGTPPAGDYASTACTDGGLGGMCTLLSSGVASGNAAVVRQVTLGRRSSATASAIRLGLVGTPGPTPGRTGVTPPSNGLDLANCDSTGTARRMFFNERGQIVTDTSAHTPCRGAIYLTGRSNEDVEGNRAVEFNTVGMARAYRYSSSASAWK